MRRVLPIVRFSLIILLLAALACPALSEDINTLTKKAKDGDPEAQYNLGIALSSKDLPWPGDFQLAMEWLHKAAEQGHIKAQFALGNIFTEGKITPQDYAEGVKWYRKAAEQGNAGAQYNLGLHYYDGKGVPQDYVLAYFWTSLSASRSTGDDYNKSVKYREEAAKKLTPEQLLNAQKMTREWEAKHPKK
jgi:TPR repeat protein